MADTKHVGRVVKSGKRCVVVFRVLPNDPDHCLILPTESLSDADHDSVINFVNSGAAQESYELGEAMQRAILSDGSIMLARFHTSGQFVRIATSEVEMVPNAQTSVVLKDLNEAIATQRGVTVADLAMSPPQQAEVETIASSQDVKPSTMDEIIVEESVPADINQPLTDEQLAAQYRSQADAMFKEAKRLREQAEELVPTKRKTKASA